MYFRKLTLRGRITYIVTAILSSLVIAGIGFAWWAAQSADPMPEALTALESSPAVTVDYTLWLTFTPTAQPPTSGFIFYPGGRVDPRAYAPAAHAVAAAGYFVAIVPMPLNLALFGSDRATEVMAAFPMIEHWAIGGHSLGGTMAASFVAEHPDLIETLVLWAAYPPAGVTLTDQPDIQATIIYGTNDGLATVADIEASRSQLPATAQFVPIEGGNHAQFGWYGKQPGDNEATIGRAAQQEEIIAATIQALTEGSVQQ